MVLLVFAHRGEAQDCFTFHNLQKVKFPDFFPELDLYHGDDYYLLLCKEGVVNALSNTLLALTFLQQKSPISAVINLGIAAALGDIPIDQVCYIRTCYRESSYIEFKSFSSDLNSEMIEQSSVFDSISVDRRIFNTEQSKNLAIIAPIAEREAWGVAYAARKFSINFFAVKVISDRANSEQSCFDIQERGGHFSKILFNELLRFLAILKNNQISQPLKDFRNLPVFNFILKELQLKENDLHITYSQQQKLNFLGTDAQQKFMTEKTAKIELSQIAFIKAKEIHLLRDPKNGKIQNRKDATNLVIDILDHFQNPILTKLNAISYQQLHPLRQSGFHIKLDPGLEDLSLQISARISDQKMVDSLQKALINFSYDDYLNKMTDIEI